MESQKFNQNQKEDIRWIRKAQKGKARAFEKIVLKYQRTIYSLARKMILSHNDTNDIVQETFVKAYLNLKNYDESYLFYPWLRRIAINTTLNFIEKKRRYHKTFKQDNERVDLLSPDGNPLKQIIQDEHKKEIAEAIEKLPIEQRMVFVLKTTEELSYQEISERLNISVGTVMSRLSRARQRLKKLLKLNLLDNDFEG